MNENKYQVTGRQLLGLLLLAYIFSFAIRMIWVYQFQGNADFLWNGQLMINTNDGYFFASGAQEALSGLHANNPRVFGIWDYGVIFFTTLFARITPFSLETITLYMPAFVSSIVVIPIILIARLYKQTLWGFFAALLGAITWSYYNRTMTGYYDTDMFSAMAPMFILYFLIKSTIDFNLRSAFYAAVAIIFYPFLYDQGQAIVYAMGIIYGAYMVVYHRNSKTTYASLILIFLALTPLGLFKPLIYLVQLVLVSVAYIILQKKEFQSKYLMITSVILLILFLLLGNVFGLIYAKVFSYVTTGTNESGLHFYSVNQTVREAGKVLFFPAPSGAPYQANIAHRMMGSSVGLVAALLGYVVMLFRHKAFILALPLIGIGVFAHWGGLRFTVYAVPVAAMSAIYLFVVISELITSTRWKYALVALTTAALIYPNITHIIGYQVPTVFNKTEVQDLVKLDKIADPKDYTLTWWDYGYPIWYYSDTSTLIDGGKHNNDNFIISTIMQTDSPELAARLSRVAVETYVDSNYSIVADTLFKNGKKDQLDPNIYLEQLKDGSIKTPPKSRDIYLYMPYKMLNIFPTVAVFGNMNLTTGNPKRKIVFSPLKATQATAKAIQFTNGYVFDPTAGILHIGARKVKIGQFIITKNSYDDRVNLKSQRYHMDGKFNLIFMSSYGQFVLVDRKTFNSMFVQMFVLGKYDSRYFEPVVTSPYSRIYRLKI